MKGLRILILLLLVISTGAVYATTIQTTDKGAEQIELYGGKSGPVPFPHRAHQEVLPDCAVCHELFPQETGAIEKLKASGELKKKQIMNKHCTKCHRKMKQEGQKTGPTTCKSCHVKK
ncbi:MAG: cytochrome c3 family protein [Desulfobacterales bacterium]|nr:cytochrome c3 family protein [Desulfobacterales bacterium]MDJ0856024.1 cytochrome c3 family protein [Desulfobacterales bacterium]